MRLPVIPPRQVRIGDAAAFTGTTPRAVRHYHQIGLLPEPPRGADGRRRYGHEEIVRLLWIRTMADAGIALDDIRDAFTATAPAGDRDVAGILERLERKLTAREAELRRQRSAVARMRTRGHRRGLLSDLVSRRLEDLPEGSLRQTDLDALLVTERIFGPLGAAVQATRFLALATHPALREEEDRVEAAEEALDDTVAVDDPRVAQVAAARHAFERDLHAVVEDSGLARREETFLDAWEDPDPVADDERRPASAVGAVGKLPHDFSPARLRCLELTAELAAGEESLPT